MKHKRILTHWRVVFTALCVFFTTSTSLSTQARSNDLMQEASILPMIYVGQFDGINYTIYAINLTDYSTRVVLEHPFIDASDVKATMSPNNGTVALTVIPEGSSPFWETSLWIANIDGTTPKLLASDITADTPIWAANGRQLTYVKLNSMDGTVYHYESKTVDILTGHVESVGTHDAMSVRLLSWSEDEQDLYTQEFMNNGDASIWATNFETGHRDILVNGDLGNLPTSISFSPDGKQMAFVRLQRETSDIETSICVLNISDGSLSTLNTSQFFFYESVIWAQYGQSLWFSGRDGNGELLHTFSFDMGDSELRTTTDPDGLVPLATLYDGSLIAWKSSETNTALYLLGSEHKLIAEGKYTDWLGVIYPAEDIPHTPRQSANTLPFNIPPNMPSLTSFPSLLSPSASGDEVASKAQTYVDAEHHYITGGHGQIGDVSPYHYVTQYVDNYCHTYPNRGLCTEHRHFDCVGMVWKAFSETGAGDKLVGGAEPWTVSYIRNYWETNHPDRVHYDYNWSGRQPGDVVIVNNGYHVGILAAGDQFINASGNTCINPSGCGGRGVVNDPLSDWSSGFVAYLDIDWGENLPPNPPILQSPANGSLHNSRSVTLSWQDGGDPDNQPRDYRDYYAEVWASGWSQTLDWTTNTSWQVTVPNDGSYSWHVRAGDGELPSAWSETRIFQVDATPPTQASNVRPNGWTGPYTGDTTPSFDWNAATDSGTGMAGYYVAVDDRTPDGGGGNDWWAGNVTTYNVPNALPEGQHRFAVTSKDNAGNVNPVNGGADAPYYVFSIDVNPPTIPQITVGGSGCSGIPNNGWQNTCNTPTFSWTSSDNVSGVKDYRYYWGTSATGTPNIITTATTFAPGEIVASGGVATRTLNITARDQLDHESGRASFTVRYDGAPPTVTLAINGGATTTNQINVWLDLIASDVGSGAYQMRFSNNGLEWSTWEAYANAKLWTLPALDRRTHTLYVQVRDRAGNESPIVSDDITLDLYPVMPHSASFRICDDVVDVGGSVGLTSSNFSLISAIGQSWASGAAANSSPIHTERSGFLASVDGCRPITHAVTANYTVTQWVIASGGNLRGSSSFRLGDTAGQTAASGTNAFTSTSFTLSSGFWAQITGTVPPTSTINPTPEPPTPTPSPTPGPTPTPQPSSFGVSINNGALYTNNSDVTVNTWAPDVTQVRLSNDGGYADAGWMTYQLTHTWIISTYGDYVMPRTVYAWFKDVQAQVYGPYQDDIVYDPVAPQGSVQIVGDVPQRFSPTAAVTLSLEASDNSSGVAQMRLGEDTLENAAWQPFTDTVTWTLQSNLIYAQFRDNAGNVSAIYDSDYGEHALASRPISVTIDGPTLGLTSTAYTFSANVLPVTATLPITYIWQASGHMPITHAATLSPGDFLSFTWDITSTQRLTVTALNNLGVATGTYSITILGSTPTCPLPLTDIGIDGPLDYYYSATLYVDTLYTFAAIPTPDEATPPISYTWAPTPEYGQGGPYSSYQWSEPGTYTITLTAQNCSGIPVTAQKVATVYTTQQRIYLPLVLRNQ